MTWNDFLDHMRRSGLKPHEKEFMDDYGSMAARKYPRLQDRYFRCMFAVTQIEELGFETYVFPSPTDASAFEELMEKDNGWLRRENLVFHTDPDDTMFLKNVLRKILED